MKLVIFCLLAVVQQAFPEEKHYSCSCTDRVYVPICGAPVKGSGNVIQFDNVCALAVYNCNNPLSKYSQQTNSACYTSQVSTASVTDSTARASSLTTISGVPFKKRPPMPLIPLSLFRSETPTIPSISSMHTNFPPISMPSQIPKPKSVRLKFHGAISIDPFSFNPKHPIPGIFKSQEQPSMGSYDSVSSQDSVVASSGGPSFYGKRGDIIRGEIVVSTQNSQCIGPMCQSPQPQQASSADSTAARQNGAISYTAPPSQQAQFDVRRLGSNGNRIRFQSAGQASSSSVTLGSTSGCVGPLCQSKKPTIRKKHFIRAQLSTSAPPSGQQSTSQSNTAPHQGALREHRSRIRSPSVSSVASEPEDVTNSHDAIQKSAPPKTNLSATPFNHLFSNMFSHKNTWSLQSKPPTRHSKAAPQPIRNSFGAHSGKKLSSFSFMNSIMKPKTGLSLSFDRTNAKKTQQSQAVNVPSKLSRNGDYMKPKTRKSVKPTDWLSLSFDRTKAKKTQKSKTVNVPSDLQTNGDDTMLSQRNNWATSNKLPHEPSTKQSLLLLSFGSKVEAKSHKCEGYLCGQVNSHVHGTKTTELPATSFSFHRDHSISSIFKSMSILNKNTVAPNHRPARVTKKTYTTKHSTLSNPMGWPANSHKTYGPRRIKSKFDTPRQPQVNDRKKKTDLLSFNSFMSF